MRVLIFILDASILLSIILLAIYLFVSGYDKGRREAGKDKKAARRPNKKDGKGRRRK